MKVLDYVLDLDCGLEEVFLGDILQYGNEFPAVVSEYLRTFLYKECGCGLSYAGKNLIAFLVRVFVIVVLEVINVIHHDTDVLYVASLKACHILI